jgi:hypothetical protein
MRCTPCLRVVYLPAVILLQARPSSMSVGEQAGVPMFSKWDCRPARTTVQSGEERLDKRLLFFAFIDNIKRNF